VSQDRYWQSRFVPSAQARLHLLREDRIQDGTHHPKFQQQSPGLSLNGFVLDLYASILYRLLLASGDEVR
jgi:hypothetical protein